MVWFTKSVAAVIALAMGAVSVSASGEVTEVRIVPRVVHRRF